MLNMLYHTVPVPVPSYGALLSNYVLSNHTDDRSLPMKKVIITFLQMLFFITVVWIRIRDPVFGAFLTPGSGIQDGKKSRLYFRELRNNFLD